MKTPKTCQAYIAKAVCHEGVAIVHCKISCSCSIHDITAHCTAESLDIMQMQVLLSTVRKPTLTRAVASAQLLQTSVAARPAHPGSRAALPMALLQLSHPMCRPGRLQCSSS